MPKITALPNTTVPATDDLVPFVDVSGTPTTRKATVENLAASTAFTGQYVSSGELLLNVRDFGAVGNNSTDDTAAIQAAVDAAAAASPSGATIYFPPGSYLMDSVVVTTGGIHFLGAGRGLSQSGVRRGTVLRRPDDATGVMISLGGSNSSISRMTIRGGLPALADVDGVDPMTYPACVQVSKGRTVITDTQITEGGIGLRTAADSSMTMLVDNVYVTGTHSYGIYLGGGADNKFSHCMVFQCGVTDDLPAVDGIRITTGGGASKWTTCHSSGHGRDGFNINANSVELSNCQSESNGRYGVYVQGIQSFSMVGGTSWGNANQGVRLFDTRHSRVIGVDIRNNDSVGLAFFGAATANVISGNVMYDHSDVEFPSDSGTTADGKPVSDDKKQTRPLTFGATTVSNLVVGNMMRAADHLTGGYTDSGTSNTFANNIT